MKLIRKIFKVKRKISDELGQPTEADWQRLVRREKQSELFWFLLVCFLCVAFVGVFLFKMGYIY